jgi:hypothetical protein
VGAPLGRRMGIWDGVAGVALATRDLKIWLYYNAGRTVDERRDEENNNSLWKKQNRELGGRGKERERDRERQTERETEREQNRERDRERERLLATFC